MTSVLVVEDDPLLAKAIGRALDDEGFAVTMVPGCQAALSRLAAKDIDVLVTDLQLESDTGMDLLESLPTVSPRTRAVLMSGLATARDYERALNLGAVRVLCKPFTPNELIESVRHAVDCERCFHGSVHGLSLIDMLQMFQYGRRCLTLTVSDESTGRIYVRDGQIIHAEHRGEVGEAAVRALLRMSAGTVTTSVLPGKIEQTVTRELSHVLLDALRTLDETSEGSSELGSFETEIPSGERAAPSALELLAGLRQIDGYMAACLAHAITGEVITHDGSPDLSTVAADSARMLQRARSTAVAMGMDDEAPNLLVTAPGHFHWLHSLSTARPVFVHAMFDRRFANPAMANLAMANAVRSLAL